MGKIIYNLRENRQGDVVLKENRAYDRFGRLAETAAGFGSKVTYAYDSMGRLARQTVDGTPIDYEYTKRGQLAAKYLGGKLNPEASVSYEYSKSGQVVARTANGVRHTYEYDRKGQLLAVKDADGNDVERYAYDKAGNMLKKTVNGKTTTFAFDAANQLVSSTTDGVTTRYAYDAAGRLVKEGGKRYTYGYLDKVLSVTDGDTTRTYTYHADGQLASATVGGDLRAARNAPQTEAFLWDGLALVQRGDEQFVNEPHVGGGNPVASSKGTSYFNDALGTTVGSKSNGKYSAAALTAFGEDLTVHTPTPTQNSNFYTGKPYVEGLGHAFLMRNYRAGLAKWQTADPMGYPDGWNALAYCGNGAMNAVDLWGACGVDCHREIWHKRRNDSIIYNYDDIRPLTPEAKGFVPNDNLREILKLLSGNTVRHFNETESTPEWVWLKNDEWSSGHDHYKNESSYLYYMDCTRYYAEYSKSDVIAVIGGLGTVAGAAFEIVSILWPNLRIPKWITAGTAMAGLTTWLADVVHDDAVRLELAVDYAYRPGRELKIEYWHRWEE